VPAFSFAVKEEAHIVSCVFLEAAYIQIVWIDFGSLVDCIFTVF
jgi:hypothetical protein